MKCNDKQFIFEKTGAFYAVISSKDRSDLWLSILQICVIMKRIEKDTHRNLSYTCYSWWKGAKAPC